MVKCGMRLSCVWPFQKLSHRAFALKAIARHSSSQSFIEADRIWHGRGIARGPLHVTKVVYRHAGGYDQYVLLSQRADSLTEAVVLDWILSIEQRYLHDRDVERISRRIKRWNRHVESEPCAICNTGCADTAFEARPDAVVEATLNTLHLDARTPQQAHHFFGHRLASDIGVLFFVVIPRKAVETSASNYVSLIVNGLNSSRVDVLVDQIGLFGRVYLDPVRSGLPMRREDNDRPWVNSASNLFAYFAELLVGRMVYVVHYVGLVNRLSMI